MIKPGSDEEKAFKEKQIKVIKGVLRLAFPNEDEEEFDLFDDIEEYTEMSRKVLDLLEKKDQSPATKEYYRAFLNRFPVERKRFQKMHRIHETFRTEFLTKYPNHGKKEEKKILLEIEGRRTFITPAFFPFAASLWFAYFFATSPTVAEDERVLSYGMLAFGVFSLIMMFPNRHSVFKRYRRNYGFNLETYYVLYQQHAEIVRHNAGQKNLLMSPLKNRQNVTPLDKMAHDYYRINKYYLENSTFIEVLWDENNREDESLT